MAATSGLTIDQNRERARQYLKAIEDHTDGRIETLTDLVATDVVNHAPVSSDELSTGEMRGIDAFREHAESVTHAFPDVRFDIHDMLAEDDRVMVRFDLVGTHDGPFMGVDATGKKITVSGIVVYRFEDGKIVERWSEADLVGLLRQVGALPESLA
ncbi:ester cyclase [Haladaptatus sp. GCM10025707]|uniref:ester cyclase n=1 Tax=unclassified Haladaptatus TaxID=2622732 RepID=UPI0023E77408|nr:MULTISPECIES: ester cyclase [unclassified Haladaptatus]